MKRRRTYAHHAHAALHGARQGSGKTRAFYCDVLGLVEGPRPPFRFKGLWIYAGDVACIHVAERASYDETSRTHANPADPADHGSGSVDHIAFAARTMKS